ncbi:MAG: phenylalanine--tRNA ligase subunit beta [Candidatus Nealsonbacteria bacterium]|nr:phenylalanine--tRNA ligase subunit beta [Candidatus Nealsonbacteria bacterium]
MKFSYNWLQSFFNKKLPVPEKLAELIIGHAFEVEEIKKIGKDYVLDIGVLANRGSDCFSHIGMAREIAVILNYKFQVPVFKLTENKKINVKSLIKVVVENKGGCPRYTARVISDVKIGDSPKWIKENLEACGLRPINNVVDITNYVMLETGQPLHAFDQEKIEGKKIIVRFAEAGEKITTLDEEIYKLNEDVLIIADIKKPIAVAGVKGGKSPEIDEKTKTIVLESANFNPQNVRKSSKIINLKTDASWRFEHGLDQNLAEFAINRAAYLVQEIAKGKVAKGLIDVSAKKSLKKIIRLDLNYVDRLLGVKIPQKQAIDILKRLEFKIKAVKKTVKIIDVEVPAFRLDVLLPEDLIEEIGRIYGYENIPSVFPIAALIPPKRNLDVFWENLSKDILKETGFTEVSNYSFVSRKDAETLKFKDKDLIEIENPMSLEYQYLRPSLIPNLLKNIESNQSNFSDINIYELGKVFKPDKKEKEKRMLSAVIFSQKEKNDLFYQMKGTAEVLLNKLGISNIWNDGYQPTPEDSKSIIWQRGKTAEIKVGNEEIGFLGEISDKVTESFKIKGKVVLFDIDFEKLSKVASEEHEYRPISRFPAAIRDIAVLIPRETRVVEVMNKIETEGGELIRDVDLFDIYEGEELPEGKKNLAFHIIFQSDNKTLSSREVDELQEKIIKVLEKEPQWQVRKQ